MMDMYNGFRLETPDTCAYEMGSMDFQRIYEDLENEVDESNMDINAILKEYKQYKTMQSEIDKHIKGLANRIKTFMDDKGVDTFYADQYRVTYKTENRSSVKTDLLKIKYPKIYDEVKNTIVTKPLKVF